ncbi:hypothetical protein C9374_004978 [Naegleria lovaniensis]|uniref:Ras family small GTPase n=1 Tax=Naegleria lovaniensis TaxID=51637 RepID=A0AA88GL70_NAELO|nr:uncharacterized protein C9374_004978 [Naegleria lovaniensis]KAG2383011.1 hypothetical protein C9374_004978 [Naegleria lovaniensis]
MSFGSSSNSSSNTPPPTVSICLLGDSNVGKSSFIIRFRTSDFNEEYVPRQYLGSYVAYKFEGYNIRLQFYDTIGLEDFEHVNAQYDKIADIYLMCFALNDRTSFTNLVKYIRQLKSIKGLPLDEKVIFLVGTKSDCYEPVIEEYDWKSIQHDVTRKLTVKAPPLLTPSEQRIRRNFQTNVSTLTTEQENTSSSALNVVSSSTSRGQYNTVSHTQEKKLYISSSSADNISTYKRPALHHAMKLPEIPKPLHSSTNNTSNKMSTTTTTSIKPIPPMPQSSSISSSSQHANKTEENVTSNSQEKPKHIRQRSSSLKEFTAYSKEPLHTRPPHPTKTFDNKPRSGTIQNMKTFDEGDKNNATRGATFQEIVVFSQTLPRVPPKKDTSMMNSSQQQSSSIRKKFCVSDEEVASFLKTYPLFSGYIETSSKENTNINQVIQEALKMYYKRMRVEKLGGGKDENCMLM